MEQTLTIPVPLFEKLIERISRLETAVFGRGEILSMIKRYEAEKKAGKLKKMENINELFS